MNGLNWFAPRQNDNNLKLIIVGSLRIIRCCMPRLREIYSNSLYCDQLDNGPALYFCSTNAVVQRTIFQDHTGTCFRKTRSTRICMQIKATVQTCKLFVWCKNQPDVNLYSKIISNQTHPPCFCLFKLFLLCFCFLFVFVLFFLFCICFLFSFVLFLFLFFFSFRFVLFCFPKVQRL